MAESANSTSGNPSQESSNHSCYIESMKDRCQDLLKSGRYSDCEFLVGPEGNQRSFQAHKILLAIASPVWDSMLLGLLQEKGQVKIIDVDPNSFWLMLNFVYLKEVEFKSVHEAIDVYCVANKYLMTDLIQYCRKYFYMEINATIVWPILQLSLEFDDENLKECALRLISQKAAEAFESHELQDVNLPTLEAVLEKDNLDGSELPVFNGAVRWAQEECRREDLPADNNNIRRVLGEAWYKLRLLTLTPAEFAGGPAKSGLLTPDEVSAVFIYKLSEQEESFPPTISTNITKRKLLDNDKCFHNLHMSDLPLVVPCLFECDGKNVIIEKFEVTQDFDVNSIALPSQVISTEALSTRYSTFESKGCYREVRKVSYDISSYSNTLARNSLLAWNHEEKVEIYSYSYTTIRFKKGNFVTFTFHLQTAGWYPLTLACSHRNLKLVSSNAGKTHSFLKRIGIL